MVNNGFQNMTIKNNEIRRKNGRGNAQAMNRQANRKKAASKSIEPKKKKKKGFYL